MTEFCSWAEAHWQPLAALLVQLGFLVAGVWFTRNLLKTLRSFQEQVGALLKLTIAAPSDDRHPASMTARQALAESSPYWLAPSETQTVTVMPPASGASVPNGLVAGWRWLVLWMKAPMTSSEVTPWRRIITWL
jgi:hypothetical protein